MSCSRAGIRIPCQSSPTLPLNPSRATVNWQLTCPIAPRCAGLSSQTAFRGSLLHTTQLHLQTPSPQPTRGSACQPVQRHEISRRCAPAADLPPASSCYRRPRAHCPERTWEARPPTTTALRPACRSFVARLPTPAPRTRFCDSSCSRRWSLTAWRTPMRSRSSRRYRLPGGMQRRSRTE